MKPFAYASLSASLLLLSGCFLPGSKEPVEKTTPTSTSADVSDGLTTSPGGDCVLSYNPSGTATGATFLASYNFGGGKTTSGSDTYHTVTVFGVPNAEPGDTTNDAVWVGERTAPNRTKVEKPIAYELRIKNLTSGSGQAAIRPITGGSWTQLYVDQVSGTDVKVDGFAILSRLQSDTSGGTAVHYTTVFIAEGNNGGIKFDVYSVP